MGVSVTWVLDIITIASDTTVTPKVKGIDVDCGKTPDTAMKFGGGGALFPQGPTSKEIF